MIRLAVALLAFLLIATSAEAQTAGASCPTNGATAAPDVNGNNLRCVSNLWTVVSGGSPAGASGAIQFTNGTAFTADAANLFWDNTNKRLGIGTSTPATSFHVAGTILSSTQIATWTSAQNGAVFVGNSNNVAGTGRYTYVGWDDATQIGSVQTGGGFPLVLSTASTERMRITSSGNVGIGTAAPSNTLTVVGTGRWQGVANKAWLGLSRNNGTASSPTAVALNDQVGDLGFGGHDGTNFVSASGIWGQVSGTVATNSVPIDIAFSTGVTNGGSERMRIKSGGNIGIGTSSPVDTLEIAPYSDTGSMSITAYQDPLKRWQLWNWNGIMTIRGVTGTTTGVFSVSPNNIVLFTLSQGGAAIGVNYAGQYATYPPPTNGLIVQGNVGIGTSSPTQRLDIGGGNIAMGYEVITAQDTTAGTGYWVTASCTSGKRVTGGACNHWGNPITNIPVSFDGYGCYKSTTNAVYVQAICANIR